MTEAPEPQSERIWHLSGAPALLVVWILAIVGATQVTGGHAHFARVMSDGAVRGVGGLVGVLALAALVVRVAMFVRRRGPTPDDEGRSLRVLAGALTAVGSLALLGGSWLGWAFGVRRAVEVYGDLGWVLGRAAGAWFAVGCLAGAALYLSEELPRAAEGLGLGFGASARRAFVVICIVFAVVLFAASLNVVTHYSVGRALLYRLAP